MQKHMQIKMYKSCHRPNYYIITIALILMLLVFGLSQYFWCNGRWGRIHRASTVPTCHKCPLLYPEAHSGMCDSHIKAFYTHGIILKMLRTETTITVAAPSLLLHSKEALEKRKKYPAESTIGSGIISIQSYLHQGRQWTGFEINKQKTKNVEIQWS